MFFVIVAVQKGMEGIKGKLEERGYQVVYYDEYQHPIDAFVYHGHGGDGILENFHVPVMMDSFIQHGEEQHGTGVLMVNALNRDIVEIDRTLRTKTYSPLF